MAALRNGIKTVLIPAENEPDLEEIDQTVRRSLHFVLLDQVDQALAEALNLPLQRAEALRAIPGAEAAGRSTGCRPALRTQ